MRTRLILSFLACFCVFVLLRKANAEPYAPPNILLFIADDLSWFDVGCYGGQAGTPNIDRVAAEGVRLTHCFTATAMCSPTRQQLYTGLFPVRNGAYPNHSRVRDGVKSIVHYLQDAGYRVGLAGKKHIGPPASFPFEEVGGRQLDFAVIADWIDADDQRPFCLVVASSSPHVPWTAGDASAFDPRTLKLPPIYVDAPQTRSAYAKYLAEVVDVDREFGVCLRLLEDRELKEETLVVFTSEQGAQFPGCKWTCYDAGLQTATVIRWPGRIEENRKVDAMVQYVDFVPTLLEAVGVDRPHGFDGRSFWPVLTGEREEHAVYVYGVHTTRGIISGTPNYPVRSIRGRRYKLIWNCNPDETFRNVVTEPTPNGYRNEYWGSWLAAASTDEKAAALVRRYQKRPEFELYDLKLDPWELNNLAGQRPDRVDELKRRLEAFMAGQGDAGQATELAAAERNTGD